MGLRLRLGEGEVGGMRKAPRDVEDLVAMGRLMEARPEALSRVAEEWLRVRDRDGVERPLRANAVQRAFERDRGRQNIVLKARQMGMTTWVAGRFFLKTITARGGSAVQVAPTREAAAGVFLVVQRVWGVFPADLQCGPPRRTKTG